MNYYEHHIRDYDAATAHLTWDEDLAYSRRLRWYYRKEKPLPADVKEVCRQVRAVSKLQRESVENVLKEFFILSDDGWHNETCDEVITRFQDGEPEREAKKANEENRLKKHREERSKLFKTLTDAGEHAPWNIKIEDLRGLVKAVSSRGTETPPETKPATPATAPATPATATQSPVPNHQSPVLTPIAPSGVISAPETGGPATSENATRKGTLCKKLRLMGIDAAPHLQAWAEILPAYSDDEILTVAEKARERKPGEPIHLNYLLPMLKDRAATKPSQQREVPWWSSNDLMLAKGVTLGLSPRPGEDWPQFRGRINEKLAQPEAA